MHWTEAEYADYRRRKGERLIKGSRITQLPLGRGVKGLDKSKRVNTSAPEWQEAEMLMRWVDGEGVKQYPELAYLYAVPNGGFRHKAVAGKMKAQGVKAGVPDFSLDVARGDWHGLRIELKRRSGGAVSDNQQRWIEWLLSQGYFAKVCRGWEEARDVLVEYLNAAPSP